MGQPKSLTVHVNHDAKEGIWFIQSSDVPGLHAEAATLDELVAVIEDLVPELVAANLPGLAAGVPLSIQHLVNIKRARAA
jgi:predicted RNase H-like HicB family nuclease